MKRWRERGRGKECVSLPPPGGRLRAAHLDGQQPGQVDLSDGLRHGLVLHAAALGLDLVKVVRRSDQVEGVIVLQ